LLFVVVVDGLREIGLLGSGSWGNVKLIEDQAGERYAVKCFTLSRDLTAEILSAVFSREFNAYCKLRHPCIFPIYGFSAATKGRPAALVMKYMENDSLASALGLVRAGRPPSFWTHTGIVISVVEVVCGLEFIHSKGFVHRYLKPSNFLINKNGRCYIGNLGSSRLLEGATRLSDDKSTMGYTAPELYDREYNSKVEVFSFAMVLYEILVGWAVYSNYSDERTMYLVITGTRAELPAEMSSDVKSLITRCWSGDPDHRPSFSYIRRGLERIGFKLLPDVDSAAVKQFVKDISHEQEKK
jgi:serine/threonine protein kinase